MAPRARVWQHGVVNRKKKHKQKYWTLEFELAQSSAAFHKTKKKHKVKAVQEWRSFQNIMLQKIPKFTHRRHSPRVQCAVKQKNKNSETPLVGRVASSSMTLHSQRNKQQSGDGMSHLKKHFNLWLWEIFKVSRRYTSKSIIFQLFPSVHSNTSLSASPVLSLARGKSSISARFEQFTLPTLCATPTFFQSFFLQSEVRKPLSESENLSRLSRN